jgi:uncharacterized membrane protein YeiH
VTVTLLYLLDIGGAVALGAAATLVFAVRMLALRRGWSAPTPTVEPAD